MRLFHTLQPRARWARALFAMVLTSALFVFPAASPHLTQAVGVLVSTQNISNTTKNSEVPQIATGAGRLSAVWSERGSTSTTGAFGFSSTTIDARFPGASIQDTSSNGKYQWPDVVVDPSGTTHIVYSTGSSVWYQRRTLAGGKSSIRIASGYSLPNAAKIARGPNGVLWALWRDDKGGLFYKFSATNGDSWVNGSDGGTIPNGSGTALTIDIVADLSNVPHVVWYNNGGTSKGQIRYADWNGSRFVTSDLTSDSFYDADPVATVDGTNTLHVVWRKQITVPPNEKWSVFHASRPAGGGFGNFEGIATITGNPGFAPAVGSDTAGNLYATYSELQANNNRHVLLMNRLAGQGNWEGPLDLKVAGRRFDSRSAVVGTSDTGAEAHVLIQSDLGTDDAEIFYKRVSFGPSLSAQPTIEGGKTATKNNPVSVSFAVQGSPKELRWRWGAAPSDAANDSGGWQTFTNPKSIPLPSNPSVCTPLTLYTQTKDGGTIEASAKSDTIEYDNAVQATVDVMNPHLAGLPATFLGVADNASTSSSDGDPGYTRDSTAWLRIADAGDCSGLSSFTVVSGNPPNPVFTNGKFEGKVPLPQTNIANPPSTATISVVIVDGSGNLTPSFSRTIIYDPANTNPDPQGTPDTKGLPVRVSGTATADNAASVVQTLTFSNLNVTDNVYGPREGLSSSRQFWGLWIANATSDVGAANIPIWYPVRVEDPNANPVTVKWNIFTGLNFGLDYNKPGTYFVYIRFLDGAGNPSSATNAIKVTVTLPAGYTFPTLDLPMITK